jgi:hypothetical protein
MLLRDHPDLKAWLTESPPPSATPLDGEPPNLIVRSILYSFPRTIEFTLGSEAGTRYISVDLQISPMSGLQLRSITSGKMMANGTVKKLITGREPSPS